ncbi:30S ribosomal protein S2 [Candidatus Woesebacteria bacterium CG_4_10_14_0_2_um_filter_39_14]|uniref:Small ribosomal subunit protein uS2 n=4 Tax=Microgenomates group TaxID=1794810 RepID=A0A2M6YQ15_9BACT|nr:MAG: 30S ribosomal protein S2 [Candidatus Shapirobacteria bacterium CG07_land_8_20_14_0_80_39_12]PIZ49823.1 MAG: 30S ribosomal protein S2 [Candidatus Woesebacteria bacterium CG_4_10_14_0_2_um_filter_39_14]PJA49498.1 MAG: 30S ribosomal protein S2 [Candidatus Shapirobacteria bacterium CG_4_9_14_3_um_filter_39_13]PJC28461.1 MAG: 30S ribosomal protein S2 [Candidatus Shapirobacteria bacterium CG_4_9_14_0_2_um_filter_39_11]
MAKAKSEIKIGLKDLLDAGCHFGHQAQRWNPKMAPFLYGVRDGIHIFDLAKTKEGLEKAAEFAQQIASQGGQIIFVGTKRQAQAMIKEEALRVKMPFISERWLGGLLTNFDNLKKSIDKLKDLKEKKASGELEKYTKKENILIDREIARLERFFGGLVDLKELPAALFVIDVKKEQAALKEAAKKNIPVMAVVDSNTDPDLVDWVIPANDDAVGSVKLIVSLIAEAVKCGQQMGEKKTKAETAKIKKEEEKDED